MHSIHNFENNVLTEQNLNSKITFNIERMYYPEWRKNHNPNSNNKVWHKFYIIYQSCFSVKCTKVILFSRESKRAGTIGNLSSRDGHHKNFGEWYITDLTAMEITHARRQSYSQKPTRVSVWTPGAATSENYEVLLADALRGAQWENIMSAMRNSRVSVSITRSRLVERVSRLRVTSTTGIPRTAAYAYLVKLPFHCRRRPLSHRGNY